MGSGYQIERSEFERFADTSETRKAEVDQLREGLDQPTSLSGSPFGRMPWSGVLANAYDDTREAIVDMVKTSGDAFQSIADSIRVNRDDYDAAEIAAITEIEKVEGDD